MQKYFFLSLILLTSVYTTYALSSMSLVKDAESSLGTVEYNIVLTADNQGVNALSGVFSYNSEHLALRGISTKNSVVSMWLKTPAVTPLYGISSMRDISFEGVIPLGFTGLRSPYYKGVKEGLVFHVVFDKRTVGATTVSLNNVQIYKNDGEGTLLTQSTITDKLYVDHKNNEEKQKTSSKEIVSPSLLVAVVKDVNFDNAWTLVFNEDIAARPVISFEVAETDTSDPRMLSSLSWSTHTNPYRLLDQDRESFVHLKVLYEDGTYAYYSIPPVENPHTKQQILYILGVVLIGSILLYYVITRYIPSLSRH